MLLGVTFFRTCHQVLSKVVCVIVGGTDDNMLWEELTKLHGAESFLRS